MIILKKSQWEKIESQIRKDYSQNPSVFLIRSRMREELGFTWRKDVYGYHDYDVFLDFYDEHKKTIFILKYM